MKVLSFLKNQKGQSLMEVVVVIGVLIIVITALTFATISSLRNAQFSKNQAQATKLAQEGLEKVRSIRDRDPSGVSNLWSSSCTSNVPASCPQIQTTCPLDVNCYFYLSSSELVPGNGVTQVESIEPDFRRQFFIEDYAANQKKVTVVVIWTDFSGTHESRLTTILRRI